MEDAPELLQRNITALRALRDCRGRQPTAGEQAALLGYVGWSDEDVRDAGFDWYRDPRAELAEVVSKADGRAAHSASEWSPPRLAEGLPEAVWRIAARAFGPSQEALRVLDPCGGSGQLAAAAGGHLGQLAHLVVVEPCPLGAAVTAAALPYARVITRRLWEADIGEGSFDAVVSAAPASAADSRSDNGADKDAHLQQRYLTARRADWFIARSVLALRPGGIAVLVVPSSFLDREARRVREWVAARAELIWAGRLPDGAAHAPGNWDVVVLCRRPRLAPEARDLPWCAVGYGVTAGRETVEINMWWGSHHDDILGCWGQRDQHPWGPGVLTSRPWSDTVALLDARAECVPPGILGRALASAPRVRGVADYPATTVMEKLAVALYRAVRRALDAQIAGEPFEALLTSARSRYAALVGRTGLLRIAEVDKRHALAAMTASKEWRLLRELETSEGRPSRMLSERSVRSSVREEVAPGDARAALLRVLDETGRVDMERIAGYAAMSVSAAEEALGDEVYRDPSGRGHRHAPEYLAGNVRARLGEARRAALIDEAYVRNVEALEAVQPRALGLDDVRIPLGAPWIPADVIRQFALHMLGRTETWGVEVRFISVVGVWTVKVTSPSILRAPENCRIPGITDMEILEAALNLRAPEVRVRQYDPEVDKEVDVRDEDATAAAQGRREEMAAQWTEWLRADPRRAEMALLAYNERFGGFRRRQYDGSWLTFPGLALFVDDRPFEPRRHQRRAIERIASTAEPDNSFLLAHLMGYGKTFSCIAGGVRRWQMGMSDLIIYVVPGGRVRGQWREAWAKFYPALADEVMFAPDEWAPGERANFFRRVAAGEAAFVCLTYEQFGSIMPSLDMLREVMEQEMSALREHDAGDKDVEKSVRRALGAREKALAKAMEAAERRWQKARERGETLSWEDMVDPSRTMLVFDEIQFIKKLHLTTRMDRVSGLPRGESARALDAYIKISHLLARGGKVGGGSGTPLSNTLAEKFIWARYMQQCRLAAAGIARFDDWASTFTEPVIGVEMDAVGKFRPVTRLRFVNLDELLEVAGEVWDFASDSDEVRRPEIVGGAPRIIEVEGSPELRQFVELLADRAEAVRAREVHPRVDNMLKITSEGRLAALWNGPPQGETFPRPPEEGGRRTKLDAAADVIWEIYREHHEERGVQLVFLDLGTPKGREEDAEEELTDAERFLLTGLYGELRRRLLQRGILAGQIAFVHDARDERAQNELFRRVNNGSCRVLIGSTDKMGVGTNPQTRCVAVIHVDAPWRPDLLLQRRTRGQRDGNLYNAIHEIIIVTRGGYDTALWELLKMKATFIARFQSGVAASRTADDIGDVVITASMARSIALGDARIISKVKLETDLTHLERRRRAWEQTRAQSEADLRALPARLERLRAERAGLEAASALRARPEKFSAMLRDVRAPDFYRVDDMTEADSRLYVLSNTLRPVLRRPIRVGEYRGCPLRMEIKFGAPAVIMEIGSEAALEVLNIHATGTFTALDRELGMLDVRVAALGKAIAQDERREASLRSELERPWPDQEKALAMLAEYEQLCADIEESRGLVDHRTFALA